MKVDYLQPVTTETADSVQERYVALGWGIVEKFFTGSEATGIQFRWPKGADPLLPEVADLGLASPHKL